jgi:FMN phosphatase YigB (HAD superfamily)
MFDAGWEALSQVEVSGKLHGYGGLHLLSRVSGQRFPVTSGFRRLQESKIRALDFSGEFREVLVDAIDDPLRKGKCVLFRDIIGQYRLDTSDVVVVGDNPEAELAVAKDIGTVAVQILRPGVLPSDLATHPVGDLGALICWLRNL